MSVPDIDESDGEGEITPDENGDPSVRGPHPCQEPDCDDDADASTGYSYCEDHANQEGDAPDRDDEQATAEEPEQDPDILEVDLSDDDVGGDDLFSGTDDADLDGDSDSDSDSEDADDPLDALDSRGGALEGAINDGVARIGVSGLEEGERDDLEGELVEIFEAFRLGYFGAQVVEDYLLTTEDDQIDPVWGFAGSAVCCAAVVLWMRPDGDEQMARMKAAVSNVAGGSA